MASPNELSLEEMLKYLLDNGGFVKNQDLVKHFKTFLIQPDTRVIARNKFKEYINTLATIKTKDGEKYLELKRKFRQPSLDISSPTLSFAQFPSAPSTSYQSPSSPLREPPPYRLPPSPISGPSASGLSSITSPTRRYPPETYNANSPISEPISEECESNESFKFTSEEDSSKSVSSPPVPPRRKSQDKIKIDKSKESSSFEEKVKSEPETIVEDDSSSTNQLTPAEQLSVRERMQRFNKMATETDLPARPSVSSPSNKKRTDKSAEEDDRASVASQLDGKSREWLVKSAQGDYQALAKLAAEDPRLTRVKIKPRKYGEELWDLSYCEESEPETKPLPKFSREKQFLFECNYCGKTFKAKNLLIVHIRIHTGEKPYKCKECNKAFNHNSNLLLHARIHSGEEPLKCLKCEKIYTDFQSLKKHYKTHAGVKPYKCQECDKAFRSNRHLTDHKRVHTGEKPFKCEICGKYFTQISNLKIHTRIHTGEKPFPCTECDRVFNKKYDLVVHQRVHTGERPFKCSECDKAFTKQCALTKHKKTHTEGPPKGERPPKGLRGPYKPRANKLVIKNKDGSSEVIEKIFICDHCGKSFARLSNLKIHRRIHTGEKPYKCKLCEKAFNTSTHLTIHIRLHTGERPFKCDLCGKAYAKSFDLKRHIRYHKGDKPFKCEQCGKSFTEKSNLKMHTKIHTGERAFKCEECGKRFIQSSDLKKHVILHTGEKPHKCAECGKAFTDIKNLHKHNKVHTGEKLFQCADCEKAFINKNGLKKHVRIHLDVKPFSCKLCDKGFAQLRGLKLHKRVHKAFKCKECGKSFTRKHYLRKHEENHLDKELDSLQDMEITKEKETFDETRIKTEFFFNEKDTHNTEDEVECEIEIGNDNVAIKEENPLDDCTLSTHERNEECPDIVKIEIKREIPDDYEEY